VTETADIRLLIADDHPIVRMGFASILNASPGLSLVGEASTGDEALELFKALKPDVVLMDLRMPGLDGVSAIEAIRAVESNANIVILTTFDGEEDIWRGLRAGARAYLLKDSLHEEIVNCIRIAARGQKYLPRHIAAKLIDRLDANDLSRREMEILTLLATGKSNKELARLTGITEGTVKFHVTAIMTKMGVKSRTEAVATAVRKGLIALD
jgi:two-component system NarL family response regulator